MTDSKKTDSGDRGIGMDASITRRDFLGSTLLASGASLLNGLNPTELLAMDNGSATAGEKDDWTSYGGVGDYSRSNGNTFEVMQAGMLDLAGGFAPGKWGQGRRAFDLVPRAFGQ